MKKSIALFVLMCAAWTMSVAQNDYLPLLENTSWTTFVYSFEIPDRVFVYSNAGDTIIGDKKYSVINRTLINTYIAEMERSAVDPNNKQTWYLYEDIENKRVYMYSAYNQADQLLYDFSLQIGDKHPVSTSLSLTDISLIENTGYVRRQFTFTDSYSNKMIWIEGIGNSMNMIDPSAYKSNNPSQTVCVKKGDETVYDTGGFYTVTCESIQNILDNDIATSIQQVQEMVDNAASKILRDGQLLIERDGKTYTLQGQEVK